MSSGVDGGDGSGGRGDGDVVEREVRCSQASSKSQQKTNQSQGRGGERLGRAAGLTIVSPCATFDRPSFLELHDLVSFAFTFEKGNHILWRGWAATPPVPPPHLLPNPPASHTAAIREI